MNNKRTFFELFESKQPILKVKFDVNSNEEPKEVQIENRLDKNVDSKGLEILQRLCLNPNLSEFLNFYGNYNGFSFAAPILPKNAQKMALLIQLPVGQLMKFTEQYLPKGDLAWTIDYNKTKTLYRGEHNWLAFAQVDGGPACLTIFLDGEYAGNVFLVNPQPHFNILKPIAKTFDGFLDRIAKDPAAFLKLLRAYVTMIGEDGQNYGHLPIQYIDNMDL